MSSAFMFLLGIIFITTVILLLNCGQISNDRTLRSVLHSRNEQRDDSVVLSKWITLSSNNAYSPGTLVRRVPMLIYASYFYYISPELIGFQAIGFSFCRKMQDTTELLLLGKTYALNPEPLQVGCPDRTGCEWANMRLQAEIPLQTSMPKNIALKTATSTVDVPVQESVMHERVDGLEVCVAPLYWYNQWMRLIEFVELYQAQGVSHFYIYVSSVSQIVNDILKIYEKKGVVTIVYWPSLPQLGPIDPNAGVFRIGQGTAHMDCMMKSKAKFVAMIDLDDYIVIHGPDNSLLDYLNAESAKDPSIGSFQFERSMVQQAASPVEDVNNWENFTFDHLESAPICDSCQHNFKTIVLPDKVEVPSTHFAVSHRAIGETPNATYGSMTVPRTAGVCYHARFALDKTQNYSELAYTTQQFHTAAHVDRLRTNLPDLMNELGAKHQNLSIPDATEYMNTCTKYVVNVCQTPYYTCPKMNELDEWVYSDNVVQSSYVLI